MAASRSTDETAKLLQTLKGVLRDRKVPYHRLAAELEMSEANIKRIFSQNTLSVSTLVRMCGAIGLTLQDLIAINARNSESSYALPPEAESYFVLNFEAFLFFRRIGFQQNKGGLRVNQLSAQESKWLRLLEELSIVKVDRTGRATHSNRGAIDLSSSSPLRRELERRWAPWLLRTAIVDREKAGHDVRIFSTGLCAENREALLREIDDLLNRYRQIGWLDQQPGKPATEDVGLCFAMAPFRVGDFADLQVPSTMLSAGIRNRPPS